MSWNYRLVQQHGFFAVHEAYYDDAGEVCMWTAQPVTVTGETIEEVEETLRRMLADVRGHSVLEPEKCAPRAGPPRCD